MKYIQKKTSPEWFEKYKQVNTKSLKVYTDIDNEHRRKLRQELIDEQFYLCGYCCSHIDLEKSSIEHISPRKAGKGQLDYNNMIAACLCNNKDENTCGHSKGDEYDETQFISPLDEDCETHFSYNLNGEIEGLDDNAKYTINLLNLNAFGLKRARKGMLHMCVAMDKKSVKQMFFQPYNGEYMPYCNIIKFFYNNGLFD